MTDLEKLEGRVAKLEGQDAILSKIQETVDLIYGAIATEPGGKQGLIDGHRSLVQKVDSIEAELKKASAERVIEKEKLDKDLLKLKLVVATAYGGLLVLVWILEHGKEVVKHVVP